MRYKVNFHVVLYFISSYFTIIMANHQAPINLSHTSSSGGGGGATSNSKNPSNITKLANKFLTHDHHRRSHADGNGAGHFKLIVKRGDAALATEAATVTMMRKNHTANGMGKLMDTHYCIVYTTP